MLRRLVSTLIFLGAYWWLWLLFLIGQGSGASTWLTKSVATYEIQQTQAAFGQARRLLICRFIALELRTLSLSLLLDGLQKVRVWFLQL